MPVSYGRGPKAKATKLHSTLIRTRAACERCGESRYELLQCAHIVSRRYSATRTSEVGAWCLCSSCHFLVDTHADEKMAFVDRTIGREEYHRLKAKALDGVKATESYWLDEIERLSALLREAA